MRYPPHEAPVLKLIRIDLSTMRRVQVFRHQRMLASEAEAFRQLLSAGLDRVETEPRLNAGKE